MHRQIVNTMAAKGLQPENQALGVRIAGSEDGGESRQAGQCCCTGRQQGFDPPGDGFAGIHPVHRPGRDTLKLRQQQGEMGAGQNDGVNGISGKKGCQDRFQSGAIRRRAAELAFGDLHQFGTADPDHRAVRGKIIDEFLGVKALNGTRCAQQADMPASGMQGRRLDGRDHTHHRFVEVGANSRQDHGAGGVAGDDNNIRGNPIDQGPEHGVDPDHQGFLVLGAVGKGLVIEGIDQIAAGGLAADFCENAEATDTGIKDQNSGWMVSGWKDIVAAVHGCGYYTNVASSIPPI